MCQLYAFWSVSVRCEQKERATGAREISTLRMQDSPWVGQKMLLGMVYLIAGLHPESPL